MRLMAREIQRKLPTFWCDSYELRMLYIADADDSTLQTTCKSYRDPETKAPAPKDIVVGEVALFVLAGGRTSCNRSDVHLLSNYLS